MARKIGLPPGSLVHVGEKKIEKVKVSVIDYDESCFSEKQLDSFDECISYKNRPTITWINVDGIHQTDILAKIGECFDIAPLTQEDILNTDQRLKIEYFDNHVYFVTKMIYQSQKTDELIIEQVSIIFGSNYVLSFQEAEGDVFNLVRDRIRNKKGYIRIKGADYLAYSLLDAIVDNYFSILEKLGEKIESIDDELLQNPTPKTLKEIHGLKNDMLFIRKTVWPLREVVASLQRRDSPFIDKSTEIFFRDVYDHVIRVIDSLETFREMVSGLLEMYLSSISNKMNQIMKTLTIISTIFIPLTFIAGIYGMNFQYMPELQCRMAYPIVLIFMLFLAVTMLVLFKTKKWL